MRCWNIAAMECCGDRSYSSITAAKDEAAVRMIDRREPYVSSPTALRRPQTSNRPPA